MAECPVCKKDPELPRSENFGGEVVQVTGHECHCLRENGKRIAVGICCGRVLGEGNLAAEDEQDERRRGVKAAAPA